MLTPSMIGHLSVRYVGIIEADESSRLDSRIVSASPDALFAAGSSLPKNVIELN